MSRYRQFLIFLSLSFVFSNISFAITFENLIGKPFQVKFKSANGILCGIVTKVDRANNRVHIINTLGKDIRYKLEKIDESTLIELSDMDILGKVTFDDMPLVFAELCGIRDELKIKHGAAPEQKAENAKVYSKISDIRNWASLGTAGSELTRLMKLKEASEQLLGDEQTYWVGYYQDNIEKITAVAKRQEKLARKKLADALAADADGEKSDVIGADEE